MNLLSNAGTPVPSVEAMTLGTVYGTRLNFSGEVQAWAPRMNEAPYQAPPKQPVLYIKTADSGSSDGTSIPVPARTAQVEVGFRPFLQRPGSPPSRG